MSKTVQIILYLWVVIVIGVAGVGSGFWYAQRAGLSSDIPKTIPENKVVGGLFLSVAGKVAKVEGQEMTLEQEGDTLAFKVDEEAVITQVTLPGEAVSPKVEQKEISLNEIKVGDEATATLEIQSDGSRLAKGVTIFVEQAK